MTDRVTDRYPGLRALVAERRAIPLNIRLAYLGAAVVLTDDETSQLAELHRKAYVEGRRGARAMAPGS